MTAGEKAATLLMTGAIGGFMFLCLCLFAWFLLEYAG